LSHNEHVNGHGTYLIAVLGVDLGTSGVKALVTDRAGGVLGRGVAGYSVHPRARYRRRFLGGGGVRNSAWRTLLAETLDLPLRGAATNWLSAAGAARLAAEAWLAAE